MLQDVAPSDYERWHPDRNPQYCWTDRIKSATGGGKYNTCQRGAGSAVSQTFTHRSGDVEERPGQCVLLFGLEDNPERCLDDGDGKQRFSMNVIFFWRIADVASSPSSVRGCASSPGQESWYHHSGTRTPGPTTHTRIRRTRFAGAARVKMYVRCIEEDTAVSQDCKVFVLLYSCRSPNFSVHTTRRRGGLRESMIMDGCGWLWRSLLCVSGMIQQGGAICVLTHIACWAPVVALTEGRPGGWTARV